MKGRAETEELWQKQEKQLQLALKKQIGIN